METMKPHPEEWGFMVSIYVEMKKLEDSVKRLCI